MRAPASSPCQTAVVLIVFNRPDSTARVLAAVRHARPTRLYIIGDGPRSHRSDDASKVAAVRETIQVGVDWPCDIYRVYSDTNLGCARRVSSGLDVVFSTESEAIILEDDCVPDPTFFPFCAELLERFREESQVGHIAGTPCYWERVNRPTSYFFSRYGPIWGWATWRRAWRHYDLNLHDWPELRRDGWLRQHFDPREARRRTEVFDRLHSGDIHAWAYQWSFAKWRKNLLSIVPTQCLVQNIGFGADGTHTTDAGEWTPRSSPMAFPLVHPATISRDLAFDAAWSRRFAPSLVERIGRRLGGEPATLT